MKARLHTAILLLLLTSYAFAQKQVNGTVLDNAQMPVPGVNVSVKGTDVTTLTDFDGKFSIKVPDEKSVLVISYVGLSSIEVNVGSQTQLKIVLPGFEEPLEVGVVLENGKEPGENYATVNVMFASDRNLTTAKEPADMFGSKRSTVRYGMCEVSIPRNHKMGELERSFLYVLGFKDDPEKHVTLLNINVQSKENFFSALKSRISQSSKKKAFIFIHGYNVSFEDAARRTAQMSYDLSFDGAPVFYSWPSVNETLGYNIDEGNSAWSQTNLKVFLEDFLRTSGADNIYIIAHSMGNRVLTGALNSIIAENPQLTKNIREIILAAPDIDADVFKRDIAPALAKGNTSITLYTSSKDLALAASQKFSAYPRAGQAGRSMVVCCGIETIDASGVDSGLLGHSYFSENPGVLADIYLMIRDGKRASERPKLKKITRQGKVFWEFTP